LSCVEGLEGLKCPGTILVGHQAYIVNAGDAPAMQGAGTI
jgi:hypothetical protein